MIDLEPPKTITPPAPRRGSPWPRLVVVAVITVVGMVSLSGMDAASAGGYGLVTSFPPLVWVCLVALTVSFATALRADPDATPVMVAHLLGLVLLLYGAAPLGEHVARWSISWYTAGFVNQISSTGHVLLHTDARWSWPGFFAAAASLLGPAGVDNADKLLLWTPVLSTLAYLAPITSIARTLSSSSRVTWLAVWIFASTNWTQQSYFSPQGAIYFLFLAALALALHAFGHRASEAGPQTRARLGSALERGRSRLRAAGRLASTEDVAQPMGRAEQVGALALLVVFLAAATVSHQLTPVALFLDLAVLGVLGRLKVRGLPLLLAAMIIIYISYFATDYWTGHLSQLFGISGGGGSSLSQNVGQRIVGAEAHKVVVYLRLLFTGGIWILAAAGAVRRWRRGHADVTTVCCFLAPLVLPIVQPYGGEALIRAFLYGLPFAGVLVAQAVLPTGRRPRAWVPLTALLVVALPLYVVASYGNEQFEEIRPGEVTAVHWFYQHAPPGSALLSLVPDLPGPTQDLATDPWMSLNGPVTTRAVVATLRNQSAPSSYVILTATEEDYGVINNGLPAGWEQVIDEQLRQRPDFEVVFADKDATVFKYLRGR